MLRKISTIAFAALAVSAAPQALAQDAVTLPEVVGLAMISNPEIIQAQMNKEAIEFERRQAQGLYAPRVDVEASIGARRLENPTRRTLGIDDDWLNPAEISAIADWEVFSFGRRKGELLRQAARVDGASLRVVERSEFVALQVARQYLDVLLQQRVVAASQDNVAFHRNLVGDLGEGVSQGSISIADQQQAEERLQAALVRFAEAEQDLTDAKITLRALAGVDVDRVVLPDTLEGAVVPSVNELVSLARTANPRVKETGADVDASNALVTSAKGDLAPRVGVEVRGRAGEDIDGFDGDTNDVQGRVYVRWNVFDGGINRAKVQEMVRRASEARYRHHQALREAEQDARIAWNAMESQGNIAQVLARQSQVTDDLLLSYRSQFNVGRRSLLDVLDAQNTRYNTQVRLETARFSEMFARYQVLASVNNFLASLGVRPGAGAGETEREEFNYGPSLPAETQRRVYP